MLGEYGVLIFTFVYDESYRIAYHICGMLVCGIWYVVYRNSLNFICQLLKLFYLVTPTEISANIFEGVDKPL